MHERGLRIRITADKGPQSGRFKIGRNDTNLADLVEWRIWIVAERKRCRNILGRLIGPCV